MKIEVFVSDMQNRFNNGSKNTVGGVSKSAIFGLKSVSWRALTQRRLRRCRHTRFWDLWRVLRFFWTLFIFLVTLLNIFPVETLKSNSSLSYLSFSLSRSLSRSIGAADGSVDDSVVRLYVSL